MGVYMKIYIYKIILFSILTFLIFPVSSSKATFPVPTPNALSYQLYYYWDLRDRDTFIQVTNNGSSNVSVHVQIFVSTDFCSEIDFYDTFTPEDTHIYDFRNIVTNTGMPSFFTLFDNTFGFVVITVVDAPGAGSLSVNNPVLSGEFRIKDDNGYEYRSTAVPYPVNDTSDSANGFNFNFSSSGASTSFADVIGIAVSDAGEGFTRVDAGPTVSANFSLLMVDDVEVITSCDEEQFTCATNVALNDSISNSKLAAANLCPFLSIPDGFTIMHESSSNPSTADFFVGFIGLNNANNKGGMQAFTATD